MIFPVACLLARCLPARLSDVMARREVSNDAELLVLRHGNAVLRRQIRWVRHQPADLLWLAALSRLIPRRRRAEVFAVTPATLPPDRCLHGWQILHSAGAGLAPRRSGPTWK